MISIKKYKQNTFNEQKNILNAILKNELANDKIYPMDSDNDRILVHNIASQISMMIKNMRGNVNKEFLKEYIKTTLLPRFKLIYIYYLNGIYINESNLYVPLQTVLRDFDYTDSIYLSRLYKRLKYLDEKYKLDQILNVSKYGNKK